MGGQGWGLGGGRRWPVARQMYDLSGISGDLSCRFCATKMRHESKTLLKLSFAEGRVKNEKETAQSVERELRVQG